MTRADFMRHLSAGLKRLPADERARILVDYDSYFTDGVAGGRTEAEMAQSLGKPARLAAELRLGFEVESWQATRGRQTAWSSLWALTGLLLVDSLLLLPWMLAILLVLALLTAGAFALLYGCFTLFVGTFDAPLGGVAAALLRALGWLTGGFAAIALSLLCAYALANAFGQLHRFHRRALRRPPDHVPHSTEAQP